MSIFSSSSSWEMDFSSYLLPCTSMNMANPCGSFSYISFTEQELGHEFKSVVMVGNRLLGD